MVAERRTLSRLLASLDHTEHPLYPRLDRRVSTFSTGPADGYRKSFLPKQWLSGHLWLAETSNPDVCDSFNYDQSFYTIPSALLTKLHINDNNLQSSSKPTFWYFVCLHVGCSDMLIYVTWFLFYSGLCMLIYFNHALLIVCIYLCTSSQSFQHHLTNCQARTFAVYAIYSLYNFKPSLKTWQDFWILSLICNLKWIQFVFTFQAPLTSC